MSAKLHLPANVYSVFYKSLNQVKVLIDDRELPENGWDTIYEIAEANSMSVEQLVAEFQPSIFAEYATFDAADVNLNDVSEVVESGFVGDTMFNLC